MEALVALRDEGVERVDQTVRLAEWAIDDEVWAELMELAAPGREGVGL